MDYERYLIIIYYGMELREIKQRTTWKDATESINSNNLKIITEVTKLQGATYKNKGYFKTLADLQSAYPNAGPGSKAYIGVSYPYAIYLWENNSWVDSGATGGEESVNLEQFYTKDETNSRISALENETNIKLAKLSEGKADKNGKYADLTAGDLYGHGESVLAEFTFRASGGKSIKDGTAYIKELQGNAVVWNNMVDTREYEGEFIIRGSATIIAGHKYLLMREKADGYLYLNPIVDGVEKYDMVLTPAEYAKIFVAQYTDTSNAVIFGTVGMGGCVISDLTKMFQAGNEPTTIEEYEARKPIVADEYAYNEGEVIAFNGEAVKSVGDNAWDDDREFDADWEYSDVGNFALMDTNHIYVGVSRDGYHNKDVVTNYRRIASGWQCEINGGGYGLGGLVKALPNVTYYLTCKSDHGNVVAGFYDNDLKVIEHTTDAQFTTPSNCRYILVVMTKRDDVADGTLITFTDIMLTLVHSGWKVDTDAGYQSYWADILQIDSRIREAFPQGMHKWDRAYNKDGKGYIVKGTGVVDLGSLDWYLSGDTFYVVDNKFFAYQEMYCSRYTNKPGHATSGNMYAVSEILRLFDSSYTDAAALKASLQGVMLYYELAEPTIEPFDTPFNFNYRVADFGTEELLASQNSAPFKARTIYQFNAVDQIRENYNEIEKIKVALAKAGITINL